MKKFAGIAVLFVALGVLFAACEDVQNVKLTPDKAPAPGNVTVEKAGTDVKITFDAVADATYYTVYIRDPDTKMVMQQPLMPVPNGGKLTDTVDGSAMGLVSGKTYGIGVQTGSIAGGPNDGSDIVWKDLLW